MRQFLSVVAFSSDDHRLLRRLFQLRYPADRTGPPPKEEKLDLGSMTMEQFIALGEKIFKGKGTCTCATIISAAPPAGCNAWRGCAQTPQGSRATRAKRETLKTI